MEARGELARHTIVATVMSNIGFERALRARGIELIRTAVGDRYVLEQMRAGGYTLGGEQSGHVIDFRHNTTGDGPRTAITLLGIVAAQDATLARFGARGRLRYRRCWSTFARSIDACSRPRAYAKKSHRHKPLSASRDDCWFVPREPSRSFA